MAPSRTRRSSAPAVMSVSRSRSRPGRSSWRCCAPAARLVRPVLRAGPGAGGRGGDPHAAGGAHADPGAAGGVRPGRVLADPGPPHRPGGPVGAAGRRGDRAPGGHAGRRRGVPGRPGPRPRRLYLQRLRRPFHRASGQRLGERHRRDQRSLPARGRQPDPASCWSTSPRCGGTSPGQRAENDLAKKPEFASVNGLFNPNGTTVSAQQLEHPVQRARAARQAARRPSRPGSPVTPTVRRVPRRPRSSSAATARRCSSTPSLKAGAPLTHRGPERRPVRAQRGDQRRSTAAGAVDNGVNGLAPASYDVSAVSQSDLKEILPMVVVLLALLLGLVLRSADRPAVPGRHRAAQLLRRAGHQRC